MSSRETQLNNTENEEVFKRSLDATVRASSGSKLKAPIEALKLGFYLRKKLNQHNEAAMTIAFVLAIAIDFVDNIPVAGYIVTLFLKPLLFIILWGRGAWKVKLTCRILLFLEFIPFVNKLPLNTIAVIYVYKKLKKESSEAEDKLKQLAESYPREKAFSV